MKNTPNITGTKMPEKSRWPKVAKQAWKALNTMDDHETNCMAISQVMESILLLESLIEQNLWFEKHLISIRDNPNRLARLTAAKALEGKWNS